MNQGSTRVAVADGVPCQHNTVPNTPLVQCRNYPPTHTCACTQGKRKKKMRVHTGQKEEEEAGGGGGGG